MKLNPWLIALLAVITFGGTGAAPLQLQANDAEGDAVTWTYTGLPSGFTATPQGFIDDSGADTPGDYNVSAIPFDGTDNGPAVTFSWEVTQAPPPTECADGIDNDGDGAIDLADPGCLDELGNDESAADPNTPPVGVDPGPQSTVIPYDPGGIDPPDDPPVAHTCEATGGGTCYYVDPVNGSDTNPGTEAEPWQTLFNFGFNTYGSCVTPNRIRPQPGDVLYLRGGTHSTRHRYQCNDNAGRFAVLSIGNDDGTAANPITIKGYPGETAIIDPEPTQASWGNWGIHLDDADHYVIEDLSVTGSWQYGIWLEDADNVIVRNVRVYENDGRTNDNPSGIGIKGGDNVVVENSEIWDNGDSTNPSWNASQVVSFNPLGHVIRNNRIWLDQWVGGCVKVKHVDQSTTDSYWQLTDNDIRGCKWYGVKTPQQNSLVSNNLIVMDTTGAPKREPAVQLLDEGSQNYVNITLEKNTLVNGGIQVMALEQGDMGDTSAPSFPTEPANLVFRENIVYDDLEWTGFEYGFQVVGTYSNNGELNAIRSAYTSDNNCYWRTTGPSQFSLGQGGSGPGSLNFSGWQGEGLDASSVFVDPLFTDAANGDYRLMSGSPCVGRGSGALQPFL